MVYSLTWLPEVLERAGLKVAECPGWRTRGRGDIGRIRGVMCHYTAGAATGVMPSLDTIVNGRAATARSKALAGPLSQLGLGRDGTFYVVAAGRANHAGPGAWGGLTAGNSSFIGIEAENTGEGEAWPAVQLDAYRRGAAAILRHIGASAEMCCGHREFALPSGRKPDPDFAMPPFREAVAALLAGTGEVRAPVPAFDGSRRPTLRRGSRGILVEQVQQAIGLADDGLFGAQTEAALRAFQRARGRVPDGIVGPVTWADLDRASSHGAVAATAGGLTSSAACRGNIQQWESCKLAAYPDPGSGGHPWTIGWGSTGKEIAKGVTWTQQQCDARLADDVASFDRRVAHMLDGAKTSQGQFDALVSFAYNVGLGALARSTLLRLHKAGDHDGAVAQFGRWVRAGGRVMRGLVNRRAAEAALYRG